MLIPYTWIHMQSRVHTISYYHHHYHQILYHICLRSTFFEQSQKVNILIKRGANTKLKKGLYPHTKYKTTLPQKRQNQLSQTLKNQNNSSIDNHSVLIPIHPKFSWESITPFADCHTCIKEMSNEEKSHRISLTTAISKVVSFFRQPT